MELDGQFVSAEVQMFDGIQGGCWLTTCIYMSLDGFGMFWDAKVRFALLPCVWPEVLITSTSPWTSPS